MRLAYVYDAVYPWETGGVQKRVWELSRRLADHHDVHWFGLKYWTGPDVVEREGVVIHGVEPPPDLYVDGRRSIAEALSFAARLFQPLLHEEFDVVDCQEFPYFPVFPSKLQSVAYGSTFVLTWHEVWDDYWYDYLGWRGVFGKAVERVAARLPDTHVAVSERTGRDVRALGVSDVRRVPNGIDTEAVRRVPPADRDVDVLFVGRFIEEKNADLLVRAIAALREERPDVRCVLLGEGPERESVSSLVGARDLADNVTILDPLDSYDRVLGLMKAADVFALPSRREGFGITVLEALACGTPVVTIRHPGNAAQELVEDGVTGAVCEPTPEAIAERIRTVPGETASTHCTAAAGAYDWERVAQRIESIYLERLEEPSVSVREVPAAR